jgi:hypothetical protein
MEKNPFGPSCTVTAHLCAVLADKWGRAERNEMLLLLFVRGLFKFNAAGPPLLVLLKLEPR